MYSFILQFELSQNSANIQNSKGFSHWVLNTHIVESDGLEIDVDYLEETNRRYVMNFINK
jgi:hypothetical protein